MKYHLKHNTNKYKNEQQNIQYIHFKGHEKY